MKFYFFKRNRKEIVPVEDTEINKRAKKKLDEIFKNASKYNVPRKFLKSWEDIASTFLVDCTADLWTDPLCETFSWPHYQ